jgi:polar amino acid transport system substrate-binding protein
VSIILIKAVYLLPARGLMSVKKKLARWGIGLLASFLCVNSSARDLVEGGKASSCQSLNIGVSISIPPWVIKDQDKGIELDLLRQSFNPEQYCVEPNYLSVSLAFQLFEQGKLDGLLNAGGDVNQGYLSQPVVTFQNVAVSMQEKAFPKVIDIPFLADKSVVAFQKASRFLGDQFSEMAAKNDQYKEVAEQRLQLNLLFIRDVDFIVLDRSIFGYYWSEALKDKRLARFRGQFSRPVTMHALFAPTPYPFLFKDEQVRDTFNAGLAALRKSGEYKKILNSYSDLVDIYVGDLTKH